MEPCGHCIFSNKQCHYGRGSAQLHGHADEQTSDGQIVDESAPAVHVHALSATPQQVSVPLMGPRTPSVLFRRTGHVSDAQLTVPRSGVITTSLDQETSTIVERNDIGNASQESTISLNKSRVFGKSHWTNSTLELQKTAAVLNPEDEHAIGNEDLARLKWEIGSLLQMCKSLSKAIKSHQTSMPRCDSQAYPSIAKIIVDQMVCLYATRFESAFRILHIPSFWREYEMYWSGPTETETILRLKVQLVTALGMSICPPTMDTPDLYSTARQWLYAAQDWLAGPMKKSCITIAGLQVQCLLVLARQALALGGDLVWISMGTVTRTAMQMGLHRDPSHFKRMGVLEAEVRRRLWATVLELNVQAALDAGVPPTISCDDFDTEAPSNFNDEDIDNQGEALPAHSITVVTESSLQRFLFQCLRPRLEVARIMNGITSVPSEDRYNDYIALTTSIVNACRGLGAYINNTNSPDTALFHRNFADLLLRRFILQIHRPLVGQTRTNPLYYYSRKMSLDAAMAILSPVSRNTEFAHLVLLGAGLFKNRMIHASLAVASELLMEIKEQAPLGHHLLTADVSAYRKILTEALKEGIRQSAERIRLGETNVKLHMKLSMALCQSEMAGESSSLTHHLVQSAKKSLEQSYATILERAASEGVEIEPWERGRTFEDVERTDFDPESFSMLSDFNLDDLFFLPPEFNTHVT
ncbi:hypothetical protein LTR84_006589 [Exophiala bonariae]|uniref:Xylanolytic transcriptional activator regulatory domain-containing protein n=1 Tax=Exophiala bonariae TaxID=1690606 RepID=A0AAV9N369_9EURO|nr:hypothetical protein LTR84_006589 [Exophiala bonariae]